MAMRIPSGVTDQVVTFDAFDIDDYVTRLTGLSSFTVYRCRNGGTVTAYTTPTITELSSGNMPGVYKFLLDEDMTIDSGDDSQDMRFYITATGMVPVSFSIELYRPKITAGETIGVSSGAVSNVTTTATATNLTNAPTNGDFTATMKSSITTAVPTAAAITTAVWAAGTRTLTSISGLGIALATKLTKYFQLALRSDAAIATDNSTEVTEINANGGSGGGSFANTTDAVEAIRDRGDAAWATATGFATSSQIPQQLTDHWDCIVSGTVVTAVPTTTSFAGDPALSDVVNEYRYMFMMFTTGANAGLSRKISAYSGSTPTSHTFSFTDDPWATAPALHDEFQVFGRAR